MSTKFKWKDKTLYSQSESHESRIPSVWKMQIDDLCFVVHRLHGLNGWYFSCDGLRIRDQELPIGDHATPEEVQQKGFEWVTKTLNSCIDQYIKIVNALVLKRI